MTRQRQNVPAVGRPRRVRPSAQEGERPEGRSRPRDVAVDRPDLSDEEWRALVDDNVDPDDVMRLQRQAEGDEQEASDHDRDTTRDRLEGLLLEQDEEF